MFTVRPFAIAGLQWFQEFCVEICTCVQYQACRQQDEEIGANNKEIKSLVWPSRQTGLLRVMSSLSIVGYSRNGAQPHLLLLQGSESNTILSFFFQSCTLIEFSSMFFYYIYRAIQLLLFFLDTPESLSCRLGNSIAVYWVGGMELKSYWHINERTHLVVW